MFTKWLIFAMYGLDRRRDSVCVRNRALLFSSLNILPFMVASLASSALLIISFREGSECMHEQPHVFFLFASLCVAVWAHTCIPPVDPSATAEGILKSITFSQKTFSIFTITHSTYVHITLLFTKSKGSKCVLFCSGRTAGDLLVLKSSGKLFPNGLQQSSGYFPKWQGALETKTFNLWGRLRSTWLSHQQRTNS